ncbi:MAG: LexA family transcriptional regulator [Chitinophagaceae bacterium]|nr:LexA family transcriptional regulator [Chitinophagaceae bacterium]MCU0403293.1 LexA family transcriptional regulator [Chitinophagaceae bacterium]
MRHLRKSRGWTQDEMAQQLGIKRSLIGAYEEERADPRIDVLEGLMEIFQLSMDDLLLKDLSQAGSSYLDRRRKLKMMNEDRAVIHFVPVKAAAGYLAGYNDPEFVDELNTFALPMLAPGDYRAFEIIGDSMLPTPSGSVVVGEKVENLDAIKNDQPYIVVSRTDGIVYKRINKPAGKSKGGTLTLISDNPSYPPYTVRPEEIAEVWAAKMVISKPVEKPVWDINHLANVVNSLQEKVSTLQVNRGGKSR